MRQLILLAMLSMPALAQAQQVTTVITNFPASGIAADSAQTLYISNSTQNKVYKLPAGGTTPSLFSSIFMQPAGMLIEPNGHVVIADHAHVDRYDPSTATGPLVAGHVSAAGYLDGPAANARFSNAYYIARNPANGDFAVASKNTIFPIRKISGGMVSTIYDATSEGYTEVRGVAMDAAGNVYFTHWPSHTVKKITPGGAISVVAGSGSSGYADGNGAQASFNNPWGIVLDAQGNLFVADYYNHRIRKIAPNGDVTTYAGSGAAAEIDGFGVAAALKGPTHLTIDPQGNLYVVDTGASTIRKIAPRSRTASVTTAQVLTVTTPLPRSTTLSPTCGQWGASKTKYFDALQDMACGGALTVKAGSSVNFQLNYGCVTYGLPCTTGYQVAITPPTGPVVQTTIVNPANWTYAFSQPGTYTLSFKASCNGINCQNACPFTVIAN